MYEFYLTIIAAPKIPYPSGQLQVLFVNPHL